MVKSGIVVECRLQEHFRTNCVCGKWQDSCILPWKPHSGTSLVEKIVYTISTRTSQLNYNYNYNYDDNDNDYDKESIVMLTTIVTISTRIITITITITHTHTTIHTINECKSLNYCWNVPQTLKPIDNQHIFTLITNTYLCTFFLFTLKYHHIHTHIYIYIELFLLIYTYFCQILSNLTPLQLQT